MFRLAIKLLFFPFYNKEVIVKKIILFVSIIGVIYSNSIIDKTKSMKKMDGYLNMYWDNSSGKIWLEISEFDKEFLYVNSLVAGMGSNDIGLDRGQLGDSRIVYFHRIGPKILLIQPNYRYRANTNDAKEKESVTDGFAKSTIWGFKVEQEENRKVLVDATDFFLNDAHGVVERLKRQKMGNYKVDKSRSAIYLPATMNFPKNTEVEALMTYTGTNPGSFVRQVTPTPSAITIRTHHSFLELPDNNYEPREHDPRAGYGAVSFQDYAVPLDESIYIKYIRRHRLVKKNPSSRRSDTVEPIIYYVDPGVPEPVKTAMLESGRWWNQAFEAAGFKNAFQVKVLPDGAHPMDARFNMIHWVHRATRGWSYGSSVDDPRTGEIIKGNVSLGSLRLRQDYLIATGLLAPYKNGNTVPDYMRELALSRVRQLVAHEIGHTIGLSHNYISSSANRASVMDYPHPTITLDPNGNIEWKDAYDVGIGEWDKVTIEYGYQDFPEGINEKEALERIIQGGIKRGYTFITDQDARPLGSAHPTAHLWDNGKDPVSELKNLMNVRKVALDDFGENNIRNGQPYSDLEDVLVPIYLLHRYQIKGASKVVGGLNFSYALRGDGQLITEFIDPNFQIEALHELINTLNPSALTLNEDLLKIIPPRAAGRGRTRESFKSRTSVTFDGVSLAETAAHLTCRALLHPARATRLVEYNARDNKQPGLEKVLDLIIGGTLLTRAPKGLAGEVKRNVDFIVLDHIMSLAINKNVSPAVQSITIEIISSLKGGLKRSRGNSRRDKSHFNMLERRLNKFLNDPNSFDPIIVPAAPPGSPIGSDYGCTFDNEFINLSK